MNVDPAPVVARRRVRRPALTLAVAVACLIALIVAGVALFATRDSTASAGSAPHIALPHPLTVVRDGHTYAVGLVASQGVGGRRDSRRLTVVGTQLYSATSEPGCNEFGTTARVVAENAEKITVAAFDYTAPAARESETRCGWWGSSAPGTSPTIALKHPLGDRRVVDAKTGKDVAVFTALPAGAPTPLHLPAGAVQQFTTSLQGESPVPEAVRAYTLRDGGTVQIRLRSTSAWEQGDKAVAYTTVGGHSAVVTQGDAERCVSWAAALGHHLEVCSERTKSGGFADQDVLVGIARSLK